jgi:hypothetical protein
MILETGEHARTPSTFAGIEVSIRKAEEPQVVPPSHVAPDIGTAGTEPAAGPSSISALVAQARSAQRQLAGQPLPIANHNLPLIQKLFGG